MAKFFIDRPVFAWVISILIMLMGGLAIVKLPIAQYPNIAPPSVAVSARYPGASAETLQDTVTAVIEQQMNGLDGLLYMSSTSESSGMASITLYFQPGTNPDIAQVQVQNKLQLAMPNLPASVQQQGVTVAKATRNFLLFFTLSTVDGSMDEIALGNYIAANVLDPIRRVTGVGEALQFGTQYAMRIWMNPEKLTSFGLGAGDVINAIQTQNSQVPVGQLGSLPAIPGQQLNITLQGQSTLRTATEFGNILLRVNPDGSRVRVSDVARVELGGQDYSSQARVEGRPSSAVAAKLTPTANALATAEAIRAKVRELSKYFPPGVRVDYPYDSSTFVRISIEEVAITLIEAIALVFLVIYLFLQNIRATLIPTIVVPVALLGTFGTMAAFGYSINVLTMFGMVLAIGLLVDDAIVVVENVERIMSQEGLSPRDATRKAMGQITGALIGITLVLTSVFIPMAFFGGSVGAIYRQFSLAMISSMLFSVFLAMSLTPALCASLLAPIPKGHHHAKRGFFGWFNRGFAASTNQYQSWVARILRHTVANMLLYGAILLAVGFLYMRLPASFLPEEDQGYFITSIQLPVGATQERTIEVLKKVEAYYLSQPEIASLITVAGFSFNGRGQNAAIAFCRMKDWDKRPGRAHSVPAVIGRAFGGLAAIKDAIIYPINPPPISELGNATGFDFELQDQASLGHDKLMQARDQLLAMARQNPLIANVRSQGMEDTAQLKIDIDQDKASALGVALADINLTLQAQFGSGWRSGLLGVRVDQAGNIYTGFNAPRKEYATPELTAKMHEGLGWTSGCTAVKFAKYSPDGKLLWMAGRKPTGPAKTGEMYHFWVLGGLINDRYIAGCSEWGQMYFYTHDGFFVDAIMNNPAFTSEPGPYTFGGETFAGRVQYFPKQDQVWAYSSCFAYLVQGFVNGAVEGERRLKGTVHLDKVYDLAGPSEAAKPLQIVRLGNPLSDAKAWDAAPVATLHRQDQPLATAQLGYDADYLYARIHVVDDTPLKNGADDVRMAFKWGDCVGLDLGPAGKRDTPAAGDVRLLATMIGGQPRLIAMKPLTKQTPHPETYGSPVGHADFQFVGEVPNAKITLTVDPDRKGYTAIFGVPRAFLEVPLKSGTVLAADVEVLLSGQAARGLQTTSRNYLFTPPTPQTSMIDDIPTEARLYPQYWGTAEVK